MTDTSKPQVSKLLAEAIERDKAAQAAMPSIYEFFIEHSLYAKITPTRQFLFEIKCQDFQFDAYCNACKKDSVFKTRKPHTYSELTAAMLLPHKFNIEAYCGRAGHIYTSYFFFNGTDLQKIGQFPAIADITGSNLRKYKPLLRDGYFEELNRANGLISHGIGIGSFVYLRRIFEKLIQDHRLEYEEAHGPIEGFDSLRMAEKINELRSVLPAVLVTQRAIYGILSSGIHELSEADCKLYYPVVEKAILQILEQDFEARSRKQAEDELEAEVRKIQSALADRSTNGK